MAMICIHGGECVACMTCQEFEPEAMSVQCECGETFEPVGESDTLCRDCEVKLYQEIIRFRSRLTEGRTKRYEALHEGVYLDDLCDGINPSAMEVRCAAAR